MADVEILDMGISCALGVGKSEVAENLFRGISPGLVEESSWLPEQKVHVAKVATQLEDVPHHLAKFNSRNNQLLMQVADEVKDTLAALKSKFTPDRIALIVGSSTSGILEGENALIAKKAKGELPQSFNYCQQEIASPSLFLQQYLELSGPAYTVSTACSSSSKVFASAKRLLEIGLCDAAIVAGADSLCRLTINGFSALESVSGKVCDPMGEHRDGITIGEGAALFVLTKSNEIQSSGIQLLGTGESSDAHHISAPDPSGNGAERAMKAALKSAALSVEDINYINLHGTATRKNDEMESLAVHRLFGENVWCSSTKALTGHCLGAAGAIEAGILWLTLSPYNKTNKLPPHIFSGVRDSTLPQVKLYTASESVELSGTSALLSNSFAFGGSNASVILGRRS